MERPPNRLRYNCSISLHAGFLFLVWRFFSSRSRTTYKTSIWCFICLSCLSSEYLCALFNSLRKSYDWIAVSPLDLDTYSAVKERRKTPNHLLSWCIELSFSKNRATSFTFPPKSTFTFHHLWCVMCDVSWLSAALANLRNHSINSIPQTISILNDPDHCLIPLLFHMNSVMSCCVWLHSFTRTRTRNKHVKKFYWQRKKKNKCVFKSIHLFVHVRDGHLYWPPLWSCRFYDNRACLSSHSHSQSLFVVGGHRLKMLLIYDFCISISFGILPPLRTMYSDLSLSCQRGVHCHPSFTSKVSIRMEWNGQEA